MARTNKETYELYVHTNKVNGKKYVGISQDSELRWGKDGKGYIKLNDKGCFRDAIDKHGWGNFEHKIIMKNLTLSKAKTMETLFITSLNTMAPFGYNLTLGGDGIFGYNHTKESKAKMSKAKMGKSSPRKGCKLSQETKDKISNANRGKVRTNEQKLKFSKAHMGKEFSVKHKDNISEARVGMIFSDEHKQSISNSNGEFYNTKEGREIQSKRNSKPVLQFDNYKNFVSKYKSATGAEKALGISGVGRVCNGLRKTAGGYVWKWGEFVE